MPPLWTSLLLIVAALGMISASALVSAFETALFSLRGHHIGNLAAGDRRFQATLRLLLARLEENQIKVLILSSALNLGALIVLIAIVRTHAPILPAAPVVWITGGFAMLVLADVIAKLGAMSHPIWTFRALSPAFLAATICLAPLAAALRRWTHRLEHRFLSPSSSRTASYTGEELGALIALEREHGTLDPDESAILVEIIKLGGKSAKDCMTSRVNAFALPAGLPKEELFSRLRDRDWWKVPVYRGNPDSVVGVLDVRSALLYPDRDPAEFIAPPVFISATMPVIHAFRDYLAAPHSLVVVLDEFGCAEGVLTHEDIIHEVTSKRGGFGGSPLDAPAPPEIRHLSAGRLIVTGTARLEDVGEALELDLGEEGIDTIGGLVFVRHGYLPLPGERIDLGPVRAIIRRTGPSRIEELILEARHP